MVVGLAASTLCMVVTEQKKVVPALVPCPKLMPVNYVRERESITMNKECRNCGHKEEDHPSHFLCYYGTDDASDIACRCPGWVKKVEGVN